MILYNLVVYYGHTNNIEKNLNIESKKIDFKNEHLKFIEEKEITNTNGDLVFDLPAFILKNWFKGETIIATPEIPFSEIEEQLTQELSICANNPKHPLDLKVITHNSPDKKNKPLELGIKDKHQMDVHIFSKEFFNSDPNARKIFYDKFVLKIGVFGKYELGYST